jgi:hypothetical protein
MIMGRGVVCADVLILNEQVPVRETEHRALEDGLSQGRLEHFVEQVALLRRTQRLHIEHK